MTRFCGIRKGGGECIGRGERKFRVRNAVGEALRKRRVRNSAEEALRKCRARKSTEEALRKFRVRNFAEEAMWKCKSRKATGDAICAEKRRRAGRNPIKCGISEIENIGRAPCAADGPPNEEAPTVSGPKIRAAHDVGPVDLGVFMENAPVSRGWIPACYADLPEERNVGLAREIRDFLEGLDPVTCDN